MLSVISSQAAPVPHAACAGRFPVAEAQGRVVRHEAVSNDYRLIELAVHGAPLDARPGQFFNLQCPTGPGEQPFLRRPMSIYGVDRTAGTLSFLYKVAGLGTRAISRLPVGGVLPVLGPLGQPFELKNGWRHLVLLARGVGLATLASLCEAARERGIAVTAVLSARHRGAVIARERFEAAGARVLEVLDEDGSSEPERVRALLSALHGDMPIDALFTCGSARLTRLAQQFCGTHGIEGQVALEQQMACGLGMCQCCVREFRVQGEIVHKRVCWEGPVFALQEVVA